MKKLLLSLFLLVGVFCVDAPLGHAIHGQYVPIHWHKVMGVEIQGTSVEIEDGAQFKVYRGDRAEAMHWQQGDMVVIQPNDKWFSQTKYLLISQARHTAIEADLFQGPYVDSPYMRQIIGCDPQQRVIGTCDGFDVMVRWQIHPSDWHKTAKWQPNETIILGANNKSFFDHFFGSTEYEVILINVEQNKHVRARQI